MRIANQIRALLSVRVGEAGIAVENREEVAGREAGDPANLPSADDVFQRTTRIA